MLEWRTGGVHAVEPARPFPVGDLLRDEVRDPRGPAVTDGAPVGAASGKLRSMTAQQPLDFAQITRPRELTAELREQLVDCWVRVINAGGAVIPRGSRCRR